MTDFCTCGAELPPDARFCHKCGKPQRDEPLLTVEEVPPPPAPDNVAVPTLVPPEIGLRNLTAVRVGAIAGGLGFIFSSMPLPFWLRLLFLLGSGMFAVYLYQRRSGFPMEIRGGIKMGWIAGLFCFVIFTVLFTISVVMLAMLMGDGNMATVYREQLAAMGMSQDRIRETMELFRDPIQILSLLFYLFVMSTLVPAVGGAIGARLLSKS